jgi:hypothetical protein
MVSAHKMLIRGKSSSRILMGFLADLEIISVDTGPRSGESAIREPACNHRTFRYALH